MTARCAFADVSAAASAPGNHRSGLPARVTISDRRAERWLRPGQVWHFDDKVRRQDGFSLIELLVVILIIGILATVAIPRFLGQREMAHASHCKANLTAVWKTVVAYATERNGDLSGLTVTAVTDREPGLDVRNMTPAIRDAQPSMSQPDGPWSEDVVYMVLFADNNQVRLGCVTREHTTYTLLGAYNKVVTRQLEERNWAKDKSMILTASDNTDITDPTW